MKKISHTIFLNEQTNKQTNHTTISVITGPTFGQTNTKARN